MAGVAALTLSACGGSETDTPASPSPSMPAVAALPTSEMAPPGPGQRQAPSAAAPSGSTTSSALPAIANQSPHSGVLGNTQDTVLDAAVRALQATLTVDVTNRDRVQSVVNDLAHALACVRAHFRNGDEVWSLLERHQFDTWWRRLRHTLFAAAALLFAQQPRDAVCPVAPPPGSDGSGAGDGTAGGDTTPPTTSQPLHDEVARLELIGVLPALDRSRDLRGPDVNDNGVRDDIEAYVNALPLTDAQRKAAMQSARVQQQAMLIDLSDRAAVIALGNASMASTVCMADTFADGAVITSRDLNLKIEAITANTPERALRYMQYMRALSGTSTALPDGNTCDE